MKRGRKKDPANVEPGQQAKAVLGEVQPPAHLGPLARSIFERVAKTLDTMNILTIGDTDVVASYAEVAALGQLHKRQMDESGATQTAESGYTAMSADYLIWRDCQRQGQKLLSDLGLTPASRTRVAAAVAKEVDELAEFIARRSTRAKDAEGRQRPDKDQG